MSEAGVVATGFLSEPGAIATGFLSEPGAIATGFLSEPGAIATGFYSEPRAVATGLPMGFETNKKNPVATAPGSDCLSEALTPFAGREGRLCT